MAQIVLGNGSNDVLNAAARAFLTPSCEAIYSQHAFAIYALEIQYTGAKGVVAPAREFAHDPAAMLAAITARTRMLFIANPNNPTGTLIAAGDLHEFLRKVPPQVMVVLDEAYNEYIPAALKSDSLAWLKEFPNLIVTRTFSKAYGLAGLRVGYAFAHPDVADLMNRVRQPFNVNSISLAAAAAGLDDRDFVQRSFELNQTGMRQLTAGLSKLGLAYIPSAGNFVSVNVKDGAGVFQRLLQRGVIVRPIGAYGMPAYLRVSIGLESENARFLDALAQSLAE
jgi:histidinol-phosphate aminotransferase